MLFPEISSSNSEETQSGYVVVEVGPYGALAGPIR